MEVSTRPDGTEIELTVGATSGTGASSLEADLTRTIAGLGSSTVTLVAEHPADRLDPLIEEVADRTGFDQRRDLLQLRRPLPVPADEPARRDAPALATRTFDVERDRHAWLRVNNRAFVDHPDQGGQTEASLTAELQQDWFDPKGFLVADDDGDRAGELAGFCWTKVHPAHQDDRALGEIYVIGVDPAHRGEGLGASLVLAGLDHLAGAGLTTAMLYVEADNRPALDLYGRLGFATHRRRRLYSRPGKT